MADINLRWWGVLTFAGIKCGLSIVMLTMIPASFEYLEMFKAVVIGVIMLSTFIYSAVLLVIIESNKDKFLLEMGTEHNLDERFFSGIAGNLPGPGYTGEGGVNR